MNARVNAAVAGKAIVPEPYTILGVRLRPFSLGHYLLMRRFDCGFAGDDKNNPVGIPDLLLGVAICSHTYDEFIEMSYTDKLDKWISNWGKKLYPQLKRKNFDALYRFRLFSSYMKDGIVIPEYWNEDNGGGGEIGTHWSHNMLNTLVSNCGYTRYDALNQPLSQVLTDYLSYAERNGAIRLMTPDEIELINNSTQ